MKKVKYIALNTFRECIREKILYTILLFAAGFLLVSIIISSWSIGQNEKILKDFGLTIITVFGLLISIFIGIGLVYKETEKKTIYTLLSKPVSRTEFIWGKYFGILLTLAVIFLMMSAGFLVFLYVFTGQFNLILLLDIVFIYLTMAIVIAVAMFFSTFLSPSVNAILTVFVFAAGNFSADLKIIGPGTKDQLLSGLLNILYYIIPNFQMLNFHKEVVHLLPIDQSRIIPALIYPVAYSFVFLVLTSFIFKKQNFK